MVPFPFKYQRSEVITVQGDKIGNVSGEFLWEQPVTKGLGKEDYVCWCVQGEQVIPPSRSCDNLWSLKGCRVGSEKRIQTLNFYIYN